ncbi:MAG: hypothetical protein ACK53L_32040, partial [Pirellulaceae bacterium]
GAAPVGFEPTLADLQATALATWRRSQLCSRLSTERRGQGQGAIRRKLLWEGWRAATIGDPQGELEASLGVDSPCRGGSPQSLPAQRGGGDRSSPRFQKIDRSQQASLPADPRFSRVPLVLRFAGLD